MNSLIEHLPPRYSNVNEFNAIFDAATPEVSVLEHLIDDAYNNTFIGTTQEIGVSRLERIMNVFPLPDDTLEKRRATLVSKSIGIDASTKKSLQKYVKTILGDDLVSMTIDTATHTVTVRMNLSSKNKAQVLREKMRALIPANMVLVIEIAKVNTHDMLSDTSHAELDDYTHEQISSLPEIGDLHGN